MGSLDRESRSIHGNLVYLGPPDAGKTANLELLARKLKREHRGDLKVTTGEAGTWEHLPVSLGEVRGWATSFDIWAAPGHEQADELRRRMLADADGVVFVADLRPERHDATLESLEELLACLAAQGRSLDEIGLVVQYNHRDAVDETAVETLHRRLGLASRVSFDAVAVEGKGVLQTLSALAKQVLAQVRARSETAPADPPPVEPSAPAAALPASSYEDTVLDASVELEVTPLESDDEDGRWRLEPGAAPRMEQATLVLPLCLRDEASGRTLELEVCVRLPGVRGS